MEEGEVACIGWGGWDIACCTHSPLSWRGTGISAWTVCFLNLYAIGAVEWLIMEVRQLVSTGEETGDSIGEVIF